MSDRAAPAGTVVLGLGNPLMGDDGAGLAALARLAARWALPADVRVVDGGTWGLALLPDVEDAERLLVLDAVCAGRGGGGAPGDVVRLERDAIPRAYALKLSPHQIDLREVLAVAELRGALPREVVVVGVEPAGLAFAEPLSPPVARALDAVADAAAAQLAAWGHACARRRSPR